MIVRSLPQPAHRALYDNAIERYVTLVRGRAQAVYQVGNVTYPGLSDIDLLVIPKYPANDNQYFFSAFHRAPRRALRLFLHEPFILPPTALDAATFTTHGTPQLLFGDDVLAAHRPTQHAEEPKCRMLESLCSYDRFLAKVQSTQSMDGRWTIAVASALRFFIRDFEKVYSIREFDGYPAAIDVIRAQAFEGGIESAVLAAWTLFEQTFQTLRRYIREDVPNAEAASSILRGERPWRTGSTAYARSRYTTISHYHDQLERYGFPYGHVFFVAPYAGAVRSVEPPAYTRYVARNIYRLQRRVGEYVYG